MQQCTKPSEPAKTVGASRMIRHWQPNSVPTLKVHTIPVNLRDGLAWKELPIRDIEEKLVPLGPFSSYGTIFTSAIYFGEHDNSPYVNDSVLPDALITMFVRESVAK